jgi:hypothetical protein
MATNQNRIHKHVRSRLNSDDVRNTSLQNFWSSPVLIEKVKIKIYKDVILSVVLYGMKLELLHPSMVVWREDTKGNI